MGPLEYTVGILLFVAGSALAVGGMLAGPTPADAHGARVAFAIAAGVLSVSAIIWALAWGGSASLRATILVVVVVMSFFGNEYLAAWAETKVAPSPKEPDALASKPSPPPQQPTFGFSGNAQGKITNNHIYGGIPGLLNAHDNAKVDMSGNTIVGDSSSLPAFPAPTGQFAELSGSELQKALVEQAATLRALFAKYRAQSDALPRPAATREAGAADMKAHMAIAEQEKSEYQGHYRPKALALASEAIQRTHAVRPDGQTDGAQRIRAGWAGVQFENGGGVHQAPDFLEYLASRL